MSLKRLPPYRKHLLLWGGFLYAFQFLLLPSIFPYFYPVSNEVATLYWISFLSCIVLSARWNSFNPLNWIPGDFFYLLWQCFYSAGGAYGTMLGVYTHFRPTAIYFGTELLALLLLQCFIALLLEMIRFIYDSFERYMEERS